MAEILGVSQGWISKLEKGIGDLTVRDLKVLRTEFGVNADDFLNGWVDFQAIRNRFQNRIKIPKRFDDESQTQIRLLYGLIAVLEKKLGYRIIDGHLRSLNIPPEILADPDQKVSLRLFFELISLSARKEILQEKDFWKEVAKQTLLQYGPIPSLMCHEGTTFEEIVSKFNQLTEGMKLHVSKTDPETRVKIEFNSKSKKLIGKDPIFTDAIRQFVHHVLLRAAEKTGNSQNFSVESN